MKYFLLFISAGLGASTSLVSRAVKKDANDFFTVSASNALTFLIAFFVILVFGVISLGEGFFTALSSVPIPLALLYGGAMMSAQLFFLLAVGRGPVSVSTLFYSCGFIIPTAWGIFRFDEPLTLLAGLGVALIVCSFVLSTQKKEEEKKADLLWLVFAVLASVCSGIVGISQKEFAPLNACPLDCFLAVSFAFSTRLGLLFAVAIFAANRQGERLEKTEKSNRAFWGALPLGAIMGGANKLNTYLAGVFESVVTFPCVNGGRILLTAILGAWIYREKMTVRQKFAVGVCFLGIIFISI